MISESIPAMKPGCVLVPAEERLFGTGVNRNLRATEFDSVKSVASGLQMWNIARDGRYSHNADVRRAQRHDQRDGIIGSRIGIDEKSSWHAARITNPSGRSTGSPRCRDARPSTRSSLCNFSSSA